MATNDVTFAFRRSLLVGAVFSEPADDGSSFFSSLEETADAVFTLWTDLLFRKNPDDCMPFSQNAMEEDYSLHKDFEGFQECTGTLGAAFCPSDGYFMIVFESRATERVIGAGKPTHIDLHSKIQIFGPFWVVFCGDTYFSHLVISCVRRCVVNDNIRDLHQVQFLFLLAINHTLRVDLEWKLYKNKWSIGEDFRTYNFILGSNIVRKGEFKQKKFYHIKPENVPQGRRPYTPAPTPTNEDSIVLAGCPYAVATVDKILGYVDWYDLPFEELKVAVVGAFCQSFRRSPACGGPIDVTYLKPQFDPEHGGFIFSQEHLVLIPELFCAENGIEVERSGPLLEVPDFILARHNLQRYQVGAQICVPPYSHNVTTMLHRRFHWIHGVPGQFDTEADVQRDIFTSLPIVDDSKDE